MYFYSLTHLTGRKKNVDRKIIILTFEADKTTTIITIFSLIASLFPTIIVYAIIGMPALVIVPALCSVLGWFLFRYRAQKGLQMPMYKLLVDRKAAKELSKQILVCGVPLPKHSSIGRVVSSSEAVLGGTSIPGPDLFGPDPLPAKGKTRRDVSLAPAYGKTAKTQATPTTRSDLLD
ncbi:hypothetical protein [Leifsonia sp. Leaf264]|uniref:hypothetical protein n=1 Tax=Leifsonia sp. Leaf264 TaxID=1736314 RepID=UPI0006F5245C|nr:hypothetical protein [Leifsonia sp. Leaf264]KQO98841.1 hypothetical protein ASF30_12320 [Leifsonia sp. Leaf264]